MIRRSPFTLARLGLGLAFVLGCGGSGPDGNGTGGGGIGDQTGTGRSGSGGATGGAGGFSGTGGAAGGSGGTNGGGAGDTGGGNGGQGGIGGGAGGTAGAGEAGKDGGPGKGGTNGGAGQAGQGGGAAGKGGATGGGGASAFSLTSTTLPNGGTFPTSATCDTTMSATQLPDLAWTGAPAGTMGFALALVDTSLVDMTPVNANGFHWVMWDIGPGVFSLPQGLPAGSPPTGVSNLSTAMQKKAPSGSAYLGPCPNYPSTSHTKTDNYEFRLYALSQTSLPSNLAGMTVQQIVTAIEALPPLGRAVLMGQSNAASATLK